MLSESPPFRDFADLDEDWRPGRVAAWEIMIGIPAIRNLIREDKVAQMYSSIQTGQAHGTQTLDQHLTRLVQRGLISRRDALAKAQNKNQFRDVA